MKIMDETIGDRLKKLRKSYNFTQSQVADYLGYNQGQIAKIENNTRNLTVSSLEKLCELYNCPEEYILDGNMEYEQSNFAFRSEVKNIDLNTIAQMNRIIKNLEFLTDITNEENSD